MDGLPLYLLALAGLLMLSAFFSGGEAAIFSLPRSRVKTLREGSASGRTAAGLLEKPRKLLVTILLGNLLVNISATSAATEVCLRVFGERGLAYAFLLMSSAILVFGEILPKSIALRWPERVVALVVLPLRWFHALVLPVRVPLSALSDGLIGLLRRPIGQPKGSFTAQEILSALRLARHDGQASQFEYDIIANVLSFRGTAVREIMTPSIGVVSAKVGDTRAALLRRFAESGHSRIPIRDRTGDEIVGILHIKDLVERDAAASETDLRARLQEPYFVRETDPINALYNEMQKKGLHIALVLDEYASFAGLVTIEDILEELVGEIRDARDPRTEPYIRVDDRELIAAGDMEIDLLNKVFGVSLEDEEHETVAGYVLGVTGRIPREGEVIETDGLRIQILSAQPNRIRKMKVEKP